MKKNLNLEEQDFILFDSFKDLAPGAALKHFLNFLKYKKVRGPIKFSYVDSDGPLIKDISLKDNLLLDAIPQSLISTKENQLEEFFKNSENPHIKELYHSVEDWDQKPFQVEYQAKKLAALLKALVQNVDYLFFEFPEKNLSKDSTKLFQQALNYQIKETNQSVFLLTDKKILWSESINKVVQMNGRQGYSLDAFLENDTSKSKAYQTSNNVTVLSSFIAESKTADETQEKIAAWQSDNDLTPENSPSLEEGLKITIPKKNVA